MPPGVRGRRRHRHLRRAFRHHPAAAVAVFVYVVGFICSFFLPEPGHEEE